MKIQGNDILLFFQQGGNWHTLAYGISCEIDITAETIGVSSPLTGRWLTKKKKRLSWTGSSSHLLSDTVDTVDIAQLIKSEAPVRVMIGSVASHRDSIAHTAYVPDGRYQFVGDALLTRCTITGNRGTAATLSVELEGTGEPQWAAMSELETKEGKAIFDENNDQLKVER